MTEATSSENSGFPPSSEEPKLRSEHSDKLLSITEFRDDGYLQEVNRRFFHPLGLALQVTFPDGGEDFEPYISGVIDSRSDREGFTFDAARTRADAERRVARAQHIDAEIEKRADARRRILLGEVVQPLSTMMVKHG
jgi:hypothetical protein